MNTASVKVDIRDRVTVIVIDRQSVRNAIDAETQAALASAFDAFAADERQRVVIITGAGKTAFSAGHDLKSPSPGKGEHLPASGFGGLTARFDLDKPVIGAINGLAFGGGLKWPWRATCWSLRITRVLRCLRSRLDMRR